jgi:hypothetical protein
LEKKYIPSYDSVNYGNSPWLIISKDGLEKITEEVEGEEEVYYIYRHTASAYQENEYFYFKITATDGQGNESKTYSTTNSEVYNGHAAVYSQTYIIGARVVPSQIKVTPGKTNINGTSVTVNFSLEEIDYGGSATTDDYGNVVWN